NDAIVHMWCQHQQWRHEVVAGATAAGGALAHGLCGFASEDDSVLLSVAADGTLRLWHRHADGWHGQNLSNETDLGLVAGRAVGAALNGALFVAAPLPGGGVGALRGRATGWTTEALPDAGAAADPAELHLWQGHRRAALAWRTDAGAWAGARWRGGGWQSLPAWS
ncbi:MAG: hypothetical protein ACYTF0_07680, partial [Planctomycetota bacterium]